MMFEEVMSQQRVMMIEEVMIQQSVLQSLRQPPPGCWKK